MSPGWRLLWWAEGRRLLRYRPNLAILGTGFLLLLAVAVGAGVMAAQWRDHQTEVHAEWESSLLAFGARLQAEGVAPGTPQAAQQAFEFGRTHSPPLFRPAHGGLALAAHGFTALPVESRATLVSRHVDARESGPIANPSLERIGLPDFAVVVALVLPLLMIGLGAGVVQEARELGVWRTVVAQLSSPWQLLAAAMVWRAVAVWLIAALASAVAFLVDPGATLAVFTVWLLALAAFVATWTLAVGVFNATGLGAAANTLALLAGWLLTSFAVPAGIGALANAQVDAPSRLGAVIEIREAQEGAARRDRALVAEWYASAVEGAPAHIGSHTWPVSFVPRYLEQDRRIVPLMQSFDQARAGKSEIARSLAVLSPGLALTSLADQLAGADPVAHAHYSAAVDRFEEEWREWLVPQVMTYRGLQPGDLSRLPDAPSLGAGPEVIDLRMLWRLTIPGLLLAGVGWVIRRRLRRP